MPCAKKLSIGSLCLLLVLRLITLTNAAFAQCTTQVRNYATIQNYATSGVILTGSVTNPGNAVDGNVTDSAVLNSGLLGSATQYLKFSSTITAGTAVTVKVSIPTGLVGLLGSVTIQPFINLTGATGSGSATAVGVATTSTTLAGVLNGAGDQEITIVPQNSGGTPVAYDGVWVSLSGLSVAQSISVFGAYTMVTNTTGSTAGCNTPIDVISGVLPGTVVGGIANATGSVTNEWNAIDNDPTYSTYADMEVGAQALSEVYLTALFNSQSQPGDGVQMILQNPGGGLLSLGSISNFTVQLYNGATAVGAPVTSSSGLLSLSLFPGSTDKYQLTIIPPSSAGTFDRVQILLGGLADASLTQGLKVYDIKRLIPNPAIYINSTQSSSATLCSGTTTTFTIGNAQPCTTYTWYSTATGGTPLATGNSYTPPAAGLSLNTPNQYYVEAQRNGCAEVTTRTPVVINVNPPPGIATATVPHLCGGTASTSVTYTSTNTPNTYSIAWDSIAHAAGFVDVTDAVLPPGALTVAIPPNAPGGVYNGVLTVKNANGCLSTGQAISVTVDAVPVKPAINVTP